MQECLQVLRPIQEFIAPHLELVLGMMEQSPQSFIFPFVWSRQVKDKSLYLKRLKPAFNLISINSLYINVCWGLKGAVTPWEGGSDVFKKIPGVGLWVLAGVYSERELP